MIAFLIAKLKDLWKKLNSKELNSEDGEAEDILEEVEEDSEKYVSSTDYIKKDVEIKDTDIHDTHEFGELLDFIQDNDDNAESTKKQSPEEISMIIHDYHKTSKNKDRVLIIDSIF